MKNYNFDFKLNDKRLTNLNGFKRFAMYRWYTDGEDCDRSKMSLEIYKNLKWFMKENKKLEPDTMYSPWVITRTLLTKYDKKFYEDDYKSWVIDTKMLDYDNLSQNNARHLRYEWLMLNTTINHYDIILNNRDFNEFMEKVHYVGNFWIIPKGTGWNVKARSFNDCPVKTLNYFKENYYINECYKNNYDINSFDTLISEYKLDGLTISIGYKDTCEEILHKLIGINIFITQRTEYINNLMNNK